MPVVPRLRIPKKKLGIWLVQFETPGDFIGGLRSLALQENDLLTVLGAGAYGFVMSSNYNTRGRAAGDHGVGLKRAI